MTTNWAGISPVPLTAFVTFPPFAVVNRTLLLMLPAPLGVNRTSTLVVPKLATVNGLPDTMLNGGLTAALPPVTGAPPKFVTTKVRSALALTATTPKSQLAGLTAIWPGVCPTPLIELVRLPPLLVKITLFENVPSPGGVNRTTTLVEPKPAKLKLVPEMMLKGPVPTLATPLLTSPPPVLVTAKVAVALVPNSTTPKFVLAGLTTMFPGVTAVPLRRLV